MYARYAVVLCLLVLSACGGGGGGDNLSGGGGSGSGGSGSGGGGSGSGSGSGSGGTGGSIWTQGVYQPSTNFAGHCAAPRAGSKDVTGTSTDENNWLRSWTNELYLWYSEVPDLNPALYADTGAYFDLLKTSATTPSGKDKDQFHFTYKTTDWIALSQGGQSVGYGFELAVISTKPARRAVIAYVEQGGPAATAGLSRGMEIVSIDNVDFVNDNTQSGVNTLIAALSPSNAGETHRFVFRKLDATNTDPVPLTAAKVTSDPVPVVKTVTSPTGAKVGYILFNDHVATSESELLNAVNTLKGQAIQDLVLDIRYNGGGYLDIAAELAYMIAGPTRTSGQTFEKVQFNSKYPTTNPVEGGAITPTGFWSSARGLPGGLASGTSFPTLNLSRVFVLTGNGTCSASEAIINGLRGVDVDVIQIGATTCGKPYGFYPQDNCGTTYFSIEFKGVNAKGFGDYADGFSPRNPQSLQSDLPGCSVADDFTHDLGDTAENRLESALSYRDLGACLALATLPQADGTKPLSAVEGVVPKSIWHTNRIMRQQQ
jgi:C-terminal processing protease CtpA/Prc